MANSRIYLLKLKLLAALVELKLPIVNVLVRSVALKEVTKFVKADGSKAFDERLQRVREAYRDSSFVCRDDPVWQQSVFVNVANMVSKENSND